jgi:hypothetical protein
MSHHRYMTFIAAITDHVAEIHNHPNPFSTVNAFTIEQQKDHGGEEVYKVEGEAWTFYVMSRTHAEAPSKAYPQGRKAVEWEAMGWMEYGALV